MEIAIFWFVSMVAVGQEITSTQEDLMATYGEQVLLEERISVLENTQLRIAGAHSSLYATTELMKLDTENLVERVEALEAAPTE